MVLQIPSKEIQRSGIVDCPVLHSAKDSGHCAVHCPVSVCVCVLCLSAQRLCKGLYTNHALMTTKYEVLTCDLIKKKFYFYFNLYNT
jgi:hypothetical protein